MKSLVVYLIASALLVACNPRLTAPKFDIPSHYLYQTGGSTDSLKSNNEWWREFGDTTLNRLITTALASNNDIKTAASKVLAAQQSVALSRSSYLPSFDFGREVGVSGSGSTVTQYYAIEPTVSWEVPLFGSLSATTAKAKAEVEYQQWQYQGVRMAVAAQVATTYYTIKQYQRDLIVARQSAMLRQQTAGLVDSLFVRGMATGMHRQQALSLLYTAQSDIPLYERQVRQSIATLATLTGSTVIDTVAYKTLDINALSDSLSIDIPVGVPSDLLYRRSDIAAAYSQLISAAATARLSRIARLPTLSLTAEGGVVTDELKNLLKSKSLSWSALLGFAQPIYRFGALKAAERAAVEQYNQSLFALYQSFIVALTEVESALVDIQTTRVQTERYRALVVSNQRIATLSMALYRNGLSSYLDVIDASRTLYESQMQYSNIVANMHIAYIKLYKALGGAV